MLFLRLIIVSLTSLFCSYVVESVAKGEIDSPNLSIALEQIHRLSNNLEKFNSQYLINMEQKISTLALTVNSIDSNIKSLIDKSQIWELYRHHIDAWDDHMKSIEHKIELIKYNQEDTNFIDGKLTSIEFLLNHVISKMVQSNGYNNLNKNKTHNPIEVQEVLKFLNDERLEQKEILLRLNNILKHVLNIENSNCRNSRGIKLSPPTTQNIITNHNNEIFERIERKIDEFLMNSSLKDIKQFAQAGRKNTKSLEDILKFMSRIDDRTLKLFNSEAEHSSKLLSSCQQAANELSTFTESSDLLLKRIEKLVLNVEEKMEYILTANNKTSFRPKQEDKKINFNITNFNFDIHNESKTNKNYDLYDEPDYIEYKNKDIDFDSTTIATNTENSNELYDNYNFEFSQPLKTGCHDLDDRRDGVYKFNVPQNNENNRDFNERYCAFPTDGLGWTVIQRRGPYEIQEQFNRSWIDYRNGFGDLNKDFWFGNEYIHRVVYKDSYELRIELEDFNNVSVWAEYSIFQIDSEKYNYNLIIGGYHGSVSDSMLYHHNQDFSTYDRRNDKSIDLCCPCATGYGSGWWFNNCSEANLNGIYHNEPFAHNYIGVVWQHWHGDYSLKKTQMLMRPKSIWKDTESEIFDSKTRLEP